MSEKTKKTKRKTRKKPEVPPVSAEETAEKPGDHPDEEEASALDGRDTPGTDEGDKSILQLKTRLLRLQADFDNFRRRTLREKDQLYRNANEDIILELLPVLDHLELALNAVTEHGASDAFFEGFKLVLEQMTSVLSRFGLVAIAAESGAFDPNFHEAISHLPSDDVPADEIMTQVRRGYILGDRVLRAAQVVVSSGSAVLAGDAAVKEEGVAVPEEGVAEEKDEG